MSVETGDELGTHPDVEELEQIGRGINSNPTERARILNWEVDRDAGVIRVGIFVDLEETVDEFDIPESEDDRIMQLLDAYGYDELEQLDRLRFEDARAVEEDGEWRISIEETEAWLEEQRVTVGDRVRERLSAAVPRVSFPTVSVRGVRKAVEVFTMFFLGTGLGVSILLLAATTILGEKYDSSETGGTFVLDGATMAGIVMLGIGIRTIALFIFIGTVL